MFSWPVSSPFTILNVDLLMPGHFEDKSGNVALMNVICDMTQFVIIVPVPDEVASTLAEHFMYHVLIKFGICHLVILDDGSPFKGVFSTMCKALRINYDILDKRTHKGLLVKNFHRFLNKTVTIAVEDRGSNDVFVAADVAAEYAWNTSPIDGTDIFCSVPTLGRELQFPIDVDISTLPLLVSNNNDSVVSYLRLTDSNRHFATAILKILIEDRRTAHVERINNNINIVSMRPDDFVMDRTAVQSDKSKDKVAKLNYVTRGSFQIVQGTGRGGCIVRKLHKLDSPELKFMSEDLYILPPSLKSCEPVDSSDTRYPNQSHAPITNPFKKPLSIEFYNEKWFSHPPKTSPPQFVHEHATLSFHPAATSPCPTLAKLHEDTYTSSPTPLLKDYLVSNYSPLTPSTLHISI